MTGLTGFKDSAGMAMKKRVKGREIECHWRGKPAFKLTGYINHAEKDKKNLFCNHTCFGLNRRDKRTKVEQVEAKRVYDVNYRKNNAAMLRVNKAKWFQDTYDPAVSRQWREEHRC